MCGGRNACADCKGWPNGGNLTDNCGKCDDSPKNDCKPDCAAVWGGSKQASFLLAPSLFFVLKTLVFIEKVCRRMALLLRDDFRGVSSFNDQRAEKASRTSANPIARWILIVSYSRTPRARAGG